MLISSPPDYYQLLRLSTVANLLSAIGFMLFISAVFLFEEPALTCYNSDINIHFRCSVSEACTKYSNYTINTDRSIKNFLSSYDLICTKEKLNSKNIFAIISGTMLLSLMISGFFSDRFGRKRLILIKGILLILTLGCLSGLGLSGKLLKEVVIGVYFVSLAFATLTFDISMLSIESV